MVIYCVINAVSAIYVAPFALRFDWGLFSESHLARVSGAVACVGVSAKCGAKANALIGAYPLGLVVVLCVKVRG
jgi:hypothetical protein